MVNILRKPEPSTPWVSPQPPQNAGGALEQGRGPAALGTEAVCGNRGRRTTAGFPGGSMVKSPPAKAQDMGSMPDLGGSPGGGHGNPPQCPYLGSPRHRGAWRAPGVRVRHG